MPVWIEAHPAKMPTFENQSLWIDDSDRAQAILSSLGLLAAIQASNTAEANLTRMVAYRHHPTHWLLFAISSGYPDPAYNGYGIIGWLKSVHPTPHVLDVALARAIRDEPESAVSRHHTEVQIQPNPS